MIRWLLITSIALCAPISFGQLVEVTGQAVIYNEDIVDARYRATEEALKQAVLQANAKVVTTDSMINGAVESYSTLAGIGRTRNSDIIYESREGNILTVTLMTEVTPDDVCSNGATNRYRKSLGVTGFALQKPQQANLGAIHDIPRLLPRDLAQAINNRGTLNAFAATNVQIYPDLVNAPTSTYFDGSLTNISHIGDDLGVQYVMTGVIRDLDALGSDRPNVQQGFNNFMEPEELHYMRNIGIDIYLYDGFSGALLFEENYHEIGEWNLNRYTKAGYGSANFWSTHFGQSVQQLLERAALDASARLKCQPFMASIFKTEGNRVHINAGSVAGIKLGETLNAYRRYEVFNQLQNRAMQLNNANIKVTIKQVQPNFSIGELSVDTQALNLQPQDVVIAW